MAPSSRHSETEQTPNALRASGRHARSLDEGLRWTTSPSASTPSGPCAYPVFEEDIEKLACFGSHDRKFPVVLEPETGKFRTKHHRFSEDCVLVFAVIERHDAKAMNKSFLVSRIAAPDVKSRFMLLAHPVPARVPSELEVGDPQSNR